MNTEIAEVKTKIAEVEASIAAVDLEIKRAKNQAKLTYLRNEKKDLRDKEKDLRDEKKYLHDKEKDLRDKEKDLRDKEKDLRDKEKGPRDEMLEPTALRSASASSTCDLTTAFMPKAVFESPSKGIGMIGMLQPEFGEFVTRPLFLESTVADVYASYFTGAFALQQMTQIGDEKAMYPFLTAFTPGWVTVQPRDKDSDFTVTALLGGRKVGGFLKRMQLPWTCKPELASVSKLGHAGYTGEGKSFGSQGGVVLLREVGTYGFFSMSAALFYSEGVLRLYETPPITYAIVAAGPMAFFMAVEWVGKLFLSPLSRPFLLNSHEHEEAVASLADLDYSEFIDVPLDSPVSNWRSYPPGSDPQIMWTIVPQGPSRRFLKVIRCTAFDNHPLGGSCRLRALHDTYTAYSAAWRGAATHAAGAAPRSLVHARLLYGTFVVAVDMPFVDGRDATLADLADAEGAGACAVAAALAWLARNGLLYIDLRAVNVRVTPENDVCLIDYDDIRVLDAPLKSAAALEQALADEAATRGFNSCLDTYPGVCAALRNPSLWADAPHTPA